jgi:phosphatidylglycerol:prolipoprotein diacylglycerol transferase
MTPLLAALFKFNAWSVMIPAAVISGYWFALRRGREAGVATKEFENAIVWAVALGLVISHAVEILLYQPAKLQEEGWLTLLKFWEGLSSYGGFAGGVGTLVAFYGLKRRSWWTEADCLIQGLVVGWIFGRLGCTIVGDHPGPLTDWAIGFPYPEGRRHNLGLYELVFTGVVLVPLNLWLHRRKPPAGSFVALNCLVYGAGRFALDFLRSTDLPESDPRYGSLTLAHYCSIATFLFGLVVLLWKVRRPASPSSAVPR